MKLRPRIIFIVLLCFCFAQIPASLKRLQAYKYKPILSYELLVHGGFAEKLDKYISSNMSLYFSSGERYRQWNYRTLGRYPDNILKRDKFLFLPERTLALGENNELDLDKVTSKIKELQLFLNKKNVKLLLVPFPNRSRLLSHIAYRNKVIPSSRSLFLNEMFKSLKKKNIEYIDMTSFLDSKSDLEREKMNFNVDHHWSYYGSKVSANFVGQYLQDNKLIFQNQATRPIYNVKWIEKKLPKRSYLRKIGILKRKIKEFETIYNVPQFNQKVGLTPSNIYFASASFGLFGFSEFLSNKIGVLVNSFVFPGQGPMYPIVNFLQSGISKIKEKSVLIWFFPEYHIRMLGNDINFPLGEEMQCDNRIKIKDLSIKLNVIKFSFENLNAKNKVQLSFKLKGIGDRSIIHYIEDDKQSYELVQNGETQTLIFNILEKRKVEFEIRTSRLKSVKKITELSACYAF